MTNSNEMLKKEIKLIKFGIYTIGATLIIVVEEKNNELHYFKNPLQFFEPLTNEHINDTLDRLVRELLNQGWSLGILTQSIGTLDIKNFAFLGKIKNEETKEALENEVKKLKKK